MYCAHPKIRIPKPYQLTFTFLVALDGFDPLLPIHLTADLTLECSDGSMFHTLSHTAWKTPFNCAETAPNSVVVFDRLWANAIPISNRAFSCSNVHVKRWIHCLLKYLRCQLSHATSIYNRPKPFCGIFLCFWNNCSIWTTIALSIINVCRSAFKISKPLLYHLSRLSGIQITLVKLLLYLIGIFSR